MQPKRTTATRVRAARSAGFTVIELLTVVSIIALLVAILVPSLHKARDQAKNVKIRAIMHTLDTGLGLFKNENEDEFRSTNGYPPSARGDDPHEWNLTYTIPRGTMYGAHWLVRYLVGLDQQGVVQRRAVPPELKDNTKEWYKPDATDDGPLPRVGPYVPLDAVELVPTNQLRGQRSATIDEKLVAPVVGDVFGYPILYYVANPHGRVISTPTSAPDDKGRRGVYVQEDNAGFTGSDQGLISGVGWHFRPGQEEDHVLRKFGNPDPGLIDKDQRDRSFTYYICDRKVLDQTDPDGRRPEGRTVKPYRPDTYLLISAGKDGLYGTPDDITNFDRSE
ncbi:MAG: prepilin-type N-terminal cleavage/methylation domain-containing protein [Phycisphaerales bacterium]|nr:prepilin-type N-terminal cleavage/methylation domain-containing protein [Phycisphaerales bacterium]